MVIYSNEIEKFLDKVYFYELTHTNHASLYNYYKDKLRGIDKMPNHMLSTTFPMSRDGLFGLIIGRLEFGYSFDGTNAYVQYYINCKPQNDWFDWLIKEMKQVNKKAISNQRQTKIVNECIMHKILKRHLNHNIVNEDCSTKLSNKKKRIIRLTEKDLYNIVKKYAKEIEEKDYSWDKYSHIPIARNTDMLLYGKTPVKSLVTLSGRDTNPNEWRWDIIEDDSCYAICHNGEIQRNMYIFPELHKALKELPNLPPQ